MKGVVFDIQRFSIYDGPGIRTTVFLKGCPLNCRWCHNPEGRSDKPELLYDDQKCVRCGACVSVCPKGVHTIAGDETHELDRGRCAGCGCCANVCSSGALESVGGETSVEEVLAVVARDEPFYRHSGGGMTLSGGEPLAQPEFCVALLRAARTVGLHTCVETCGYTDAARFDTVLAEADMLYFDVKETDPKLHARATGVPIAPIRRNLTAAERAQVPVVLRCPVVPGVNDRPDHFAAIGSLADRLSCVREVHILPYHPLGADKRRRLAGEEGPVFVSPDSESVGRWFDLLSRCTGKRVRRCAF